MTYQRVLVKDSAKRTLKGKKPRRRALAFLLLCLLLTFLAFLPALVAALTEMPVSAPESDLLVLTSPSPVFWLCQGLTLLLLPIASALLCAGGCAYCLDLWRGRGTDSGRFFAGFSRFPTTAALGLLITFFSFLWSLPYVLLLLLSTFLMWFSALPLSFFPFIPLSPDTLVALSNLVRLTPGKIALVCSLAVLFLALYINRTLRYALAFFVLMDQPRLTARQCLQESKILMKGRKWKLTVLMLSFLGWSLLVSLVNLGIQLLYPILQFFFPVSALPGFAFWCLRILLILYLIVLVVFVIQLPLWLMNYVGVSLAGFYDFAQADRSNQPTPPRSWQVYS